MYAHDHVHHYRSLSFCTKLQLDFQPHEIIFLEIFVKIKLLHSTSINRKMLPLNTTHKQYSESERSWYDFAVENPTAS